MALFRVEEEMEKEDKVEEENLVKSTPPLSKFEMLIMNYMNEFEIQLVDKALYFADSPDLYYHSFTLMKIRCCGDF